MYVCVCGCVRVCLCTAVPFPPYIEQAFRPVHQFLDPPGPATVQLLMSKAGFPIALNLSALMVIFVGAFRSTCDIGGFN